ncbi:MAG: hypothetical protein QOJ99_5347 [Bryobacterales bacterium]|jgi:hypothetical protein|nr:hypothetical protein [Bryobacterales bacterium]
MARMVAHAPEELTDGRLHRLGEGIGKVVYASEHWVVKRERSPTEVVALILLWKMLRRWAHKIPFGWGDRLMRRPSRLIRFLRIATQAGMAVIPKSIWYSKHVSQVLRTYVSRDRRGEKLARTHLTGSTLVPEIITFPPETVLVGGWPGWLTIREATERVEATLDKKIEALATEGDFAGVELWLNRFLDTRLAGWQRGLFSVDAHLKNFGVVGQRVVLLDTGGLTDRWTDIAERLSKDEQVAEPHAQLGLAGVLAEQPHVASRFNERWKSMVNRDAVGDILGAECTPDE